MVSDTLKHNISYLINKNIYTAKEIENIILNYSTNNIEVIGAMCIGFVLGWLLGFTNRYVTKNSVSIQHLTGASTALLGGVIITYFSSKSILLGYYGIGLLIGFILYTLLIVFFIKNNTGWMNKILTPRKDEDEN